MARGVFPMVLFWLLRCRNDDLPDGIQLRRNEAPGTAGAHARAGEKHPLSGPQASPRTGSSHVGGTNRTGDNRFLREHEIRLPAYRDIRVLGHRQSRTRSGAIAMGSV